LTLFIVETLPICDRFFGVEKLWRRRTPTT
jgi:hypothetical protein